MSNVDLHERIAQSSERSERCTISKRGLIDRRWLPLNALRAFEAVGQNLSFTAGAQALSVSQSAMSRHVSGLEALIGKPLFERSSAGLKLTPAGETLLPVITKCLDRVEQTINMVQDDKGGGRPLRTHMPPSLLYQVGLSLIQDFHRQHPEIPIDMFSSHVTGLPPTTVDMAIIYDRPHTDDKVTDLLWMERVAPLCSPETFSGHEGKTLEEFVASNELLHIKLEGEPRSMLWKGFADQNRLAIETDRGLAFDTSISAVRYAMSAPGIVLADVDMFADDIASGKILMPYNCTWKNGFGYYLKTHVEDLSDPSVLIFRDWIIRHFSREINS